MEWLSRNWVWVVLALGVFYMMRRGGMGSRMGGMGGMGGHRHTSDGQQDQQIPEDRTPRDPVNGHVLDTTKALSSVFDGTTYYFESEQSREEFNKDPQRFARDDGTRHRRHGGC